MGGPGSGRWPKGSTGNGKGMKEPTTKRTKKYKPKVGESIHSPEELKNMLHNDPRRKLVRIAKSPGKKPQPLIWNPAEHKYQKNKINPR
ncbi:hypothetical protein M0R19_04720 [Candidatus Pacearchaeota archaeon]|jgi:hypothetical protein|nr:hypothetical protein [Candidatus Pacearchaeota archaeon]